MAMQRTLTPPMMVRFHPVLPVRFTRTPAFIVAGILRQQYAGKPAGMMELVDK